MPVPVHELATTEQYLAVLGGHPTKFPAGEQFAYCNGGFVVLALIAERASGVPFHELVRERVCAPGRHGRHRVPALRRAAGAAALGYLTRRRVEDERLPPPGARQRRRRDLLHRGGHPPFWSRVLRGPDRVGATGSPRWCAPRSDVPEEAMRYGLGFWLHGSGNGVIMEGYDAGVSFRSGHDPVRGLTRTMISNTSETWSVARLLDERLSAD